jgi:hypothetical protein
MSSWPCGQNSAPSPKTTDAPRCAEAGSLRRLKYRGASAAMASEPQMDELRAEARYHRERYELYRAKAYAMRPTTTARLRELERAHLAADARLRRAEEQRKAPSSD